MVRRRRETPPVFSGSAPGKSMKRKAFRLTFPHGFVDEEGKHRFWQAGQEVQDDEELALLRRRCAVLQEE